MSLIDISQRLNPNVPIWPGDTPFSFELTWTKEQSGSVNVGKVVMSTHTGTHIDAPYHFDTEGKKVLELDLNLYVGKTKVVHLPKKESLGAEDLFPFNLDGVTRILIRTDSWVDPTRFPTDICYLRPDLAPYLAEKGVRLIGLDVPSVDPLDSKHLPAHHALLQHDIHILEGAVLAHVEEGDYELIALPLPLEGADGSPVRAVLRKP
ncbi:arylformamidase [Ammoniphilus sp. YIM 78166]|uniref:arylformamidase n=1 Tax=Ammoniphilus sp. YIM 78166 TaxID=1644106 RepID=UPI00106F4DB4|nr:arylformamidase [Ammoniphilus sp. YIM 78166]